MSVYLYVFQLDNEHAVPDEVRRHLDEFLDVYSLYLKTGIQSVKDEAISKAFQIHLQDPKLTFVF